MARHHRISSRFSDPDLAENYAHLLTRYSVQPKEEQCTLCEAHFSAPMPSNTIVEPQPPACFHLAFRNMLI